MHHLVMAGVIWFLKGEIRGLVVVAPLLRVILVGEISVQTSHPNLKVKPN
jgi:hypothetical protein